MTQSVRWTIRVSKATDEAVRRLLAARGRTKGDLGRFVEESVRGRLLDQAVSRTKARNARTPVSDVETAIQGALQVERAKHRLLAAVARLPPMSEREIDAEVRAARGARRARPHNR